MVDDLVTFVEHARSKGMDHSTIRMLLLSVGWKERDIVEALARTGLDMPIPAPPDTGGGREAFFHLLMFAAFYSAVVAVEVLLFHYIDHVFPDAAQQQFSMVSLEMPHVRWSLAFVIVAFPVFLGLSRFLLREMRARPEKSWSGVRRWLTYLTLFLAAVALGGDVITLVFQMLEGDLTARFLSKVLAVFAVGGLSFAYYFLSLRMPMERRETVRMHRTFAWLSMALALGTVVWGFLFTGSPQSARMRRFDEIRVQDLQGIRDEIDLICLGDQRLVAPAGRTLLRPLPASLEEVLRAARGQRPGIRDPETGEPYGYEVLSETRFRLCATFRFPRDERFGVVWNHPSGRSCFEFDVLRPE